MSEHDAPDGVNTDGETKYVVPLLTWAGDD